MLMCILCSHFTATMRDSIWGKSNDSGTQNAGGNGKALSTSPVVILLTRS